MFELTSPPPIDPKDNLLRELSSRVARGEKVPLTPPRPHDFPKITVIMLAKNEWGTLRTAVESCFPFADELIIGVDRDTDSPISFAYQLAFDLKPHDECHEFFEGPMGEGRLATFAEVAGFIGWTESDLTAECERRAAAQPTWNEARKCVEAIGKGEAFWLDFNDHFSQARNQTIAKASGEYLFMIDGHEYLLNPEILVAALPALIKNHPDFHRLGVTLDEIDSPYRQTIIQDRFFKNADGVRFERGIHNMLKFDQEPEDGLHLAGLVLVHDRPAWLAHFREPQRHKMTEEHMGEGGDSSSMYFAALSAHRQGDYETAEAIYDRYLEANSSGPEAAYICSMKAKLYYHREDYETCEAICMRAAGMCPAAAWVYALAATALLKWEETVEGENEKEAILHRVLDYCRLAESCKIPRSTMAVPTTAYGWETQMAFADAYTRLGDYQKALEHAHRCVEMKPPERTTDQMIRFISSAQQAWIQETEQHVRVEGTRYFYICDKMVQFVEDVYRTAKELGYEVIHSRGWDIELALKSDFIWCDWADDNAVRASRSPLGERPLAVRCHSYETFSDWIREINWQGVTFPVISSQLAAQRVEEKFGIDLDWHEVTVVPDPFKFPLIDHYRSNDVAMIGRFSSKKGVELIPDLAHLLPDRIIHVGGTLQDERLYEAVVNRCRLLGITNVNFWGHLSSSEIQDFLSQCRHYVSLSPWETYSVAMMEALSIGLHCHALKYPWTSWYGDVIHTPGTIGGLANSIKRLDASAKIPKAGRAFVNARRQESMNTLRGILSCLNQETLPSSAPSELAEATPAALPSDPNFSNFTLRRLRE